MALRDFDLGVEREFAARLPVGLAGWGRHGVGACGCGVEWPTHSFAPPTSPSIRPCAKSIQKRLMDLVTLIILRAAEGGCNEGRGNGQT